MPKLREAYREIELYDPKRTPCAIDLSDNTNLFGVAPSVTKLINAVPSNLITRYPSVFAGELKALLVKVRPAFAAHLEHAKTLQSSLAGK